MTIELASRTLVSKPWGRTDLAPWSRPDQHNRAIGEIWFGRDAGEQSSALLLKLIFTRAPLSIQVHPGDAAAKSAGLANGKTEAWYVLAADYEARVALGLKKKIDLRDLRAAAVDGTIKDLVAWRDVEAGEAVLVPAGTIHAIGGGLVIAEVQQRSDTTYRLFDHGRQRELHIEDALTVADPGPPPRQAPPVVLGPTRTLMAQSPYFALERMSLPGDSDWWINLGCEAWLLVIGGSLRIGDAEAGMGEAIYLDEDHAKLEVGSSGLRALLAYALPAPIADLLERPDRAFARPALPIPSDGIADRKSPAGSAQALS